MSLANDSYLSFVSFAGDSYLSTMEACIAFSPVAVLPLSLVHLTTVVCS